MDPMGKYPEIPKTRIFMLLPEDHCFTKDLQIINPGDVFLLQSWTSRSCHIHQYIHIYIHMSYVYICIYWYFFMYIDIDVDIIYVSFFLRLVFVHVNVLSLFDWSLIPWNLYNLDTQSSHIWRDALLKTFVGILVESLCGCWDCYFGGIWRAWRLGMVGREWSLTPFWVEKGCFSRHTVDDIGRSPHRMYKTL